MEEATFEATQRRKIPEISEGIGIQNKGLVFSLQTEVRTARIVA
jgi:hypothetical protein